MKKKESLILGNRNLLLGLVIIVIILGTVVLLDKQSNMQNGAPTASNEKIISGTFDKSKFKSDAEWKKILTQQQYTILRQAGTEVPFT